MDVEHRLREELARTQDELAMHELAVARAEEALRYVEDYAREARVALAKLRVLVQEPEGESSFEMPELETLERGVTIFGRVKPDDVNTPEGGDPEGFH